MDPDRGGRTPKAPDKTQADKDRSREAGLDEALDETFPASDPVAVGRTDHAGVPPSHKPSAEAPQGKGKQRKGS